MLDEGQKIGGAIGVALLVIAVFSGFARVFPEYQAIFAGLAAIFVTVVAILFAAV